MKKSLLFTILFCFLFLTHISQAQILTLAETINQAGLQRMLSQRIAKNYILLSSHINESAASEELDKSAADFEKHLHQLSKSMPDKTSQIALKKLKNQWHEFRTFVLSEPKRKYIPQVVNQSTDLLNIANDLVYALEKYAGVNSAHLINISGRQRMLSQRIALFYLASYSGLEESKFKQQLINTTEEYTLGLNELISASENTDEIKQHLKEVNTQWSFYKSRFDQEKKARYIPRIIQVITESMLSDMNDITQLYEDILV